MELDTKYQPGDVVARINKDGYLEKTRTIQDIDKHTKKYVFTDIKLYNEEYIKLSIEYVDASYQLRSEAKKEFPEAFV